MSEKVEEIKRWVALSEDQQLEEVMAIMGLLPAMDQIKLVMYLAKEALWLTETQFFVRVSRLPEVVELTNL